MENDKEVFVKCKWCIYIDAQLAKCGQRIIISIPIHILTYNDWVWSQEQIRFRYTQHDDAFGQTQVINCAKAISILCCHKKGKQHSTNRFFNIICRDYLLGSFFFYAPGITVRLLREKESTIMWVYTKTSTAFGDNKNFVLWLWLSTSIHYVNGLELFLTFILYNFYYAFH